jgi:hypothetical protein
MAMVFISYRRTDSATFSGRIYDRLTAKFGRKNVFKDVDDIPPGVNFLQYIQDSLRRCSVALVVIGPHWLEVRDPSGKRRLDDAADFVRLEIVTALALGLTVIPLLVDGAVMPTSTDLPASLGPLAMLNALPVRNDPDFAHDMDRVVGGIERAFASRASPGLFGRRGASSGISGSVGTEPNERNQNKPFTSARASSSPSDATLPGGQGATGRGASLAPRPRSSPSQVTPRLHLSTKLIVVALITAGIATCGATAFFGKDRLAGLLQPAIQSDPTSTVDIFSQVPATPVSTPGPAAKDIVNVVTARSVDGNSAPIGITSHFLVGSPVHLVVQVRTLTAVEQHTISVYWFLTGIDTQVSRGPGKTDVVVKDNSPVLLSLIYPSTGVGMAKLYWDRPASDTSNSNSDPSLAQTIYFAIEQPTPTPTA